MHWPILCGDCKPGIHCNLLLLNLPDCPLKRLQKVQSRTGRPVMLTAIFANKISVRGNWFYCTCLYASLYANCIVRSPFSLQREAFNDPPSTPLLPAPPHTPNQWTFDTKLHLANLHGTCTTYT